MYMVRSVGDEAPLRQQNLQMCFPTFRHEGMTRKPTNWWDKEKRYAAQTAKRLNVIMGEILPTGR